VEARGKELKIIWITFKEWDLKLFGYPLCR
jgi:hypothetical protein